ncbi:MAG: hypothetical protein ABL949_09545 [Fimbriimonadaceae bacterium]
MQTKSEKILIELAKAHLLTPWCYPSPFRDQGSQKGKVRSKQHCDLLIVFGRDVIIFSDKQVHFRKHATLELSWGRWYRDAVLESAGQLDGAKRWVESHPGRVFEDELCEVPIPIPADANIHLIATCRGAAKSCQAFFGGGTGSLMFHAGNLTNPELAPFQVGCISERGNVVHVLDSEVIDVVLRHLDTLPEFLRYLQQRAILARSGTAVMSAGEEELLVLFLGRLNPDGLHGFEGLLEFGAVATQEGLLAQYTASQAYASKKQADKNSYVWDTLIEHLFEAMRPIDDTPLPFPLRSSLAWLAREPRVRRRMLGESVLTAIRSATKPGRFARALHPSRPGDPLWVFMALQRPPDLDFAAYVQVRQEMLWSYVLAARYLHKEPVEVVGIGLNAWGDKPASEDLLWLPNDDWTEE